MQKISENPRKFLLDVVVGGQNGAGLIGNACAWLKTAGRTTFVFRSCKFDTTALNDGLLKQLKDHSFILKLVCDFLHCNDNFKNTKDFKKTKQRDSAFYIAKIATKSFNTLTHLYGSLRCLSVGILCLSPYLGTINLIKIYCNLAASFLFVASSLDNLYRSFQVANANNQCSDNLHEPSQASDKNQDNLLWPGYLDVSIIALNTYFIFMTSTKLIDLGPLSGTCFRYSSIASTVVSTILNFASLFNLVAKYCDKEEH